MSSCPGKKVRLGGPVKGRGAICRDLESDLKRIQSLGVGAMIWCVFACDFLRSIRASLTAELSFPDPSAAWMTLNCTTSARPSLSTRTSRPRSV